METSTAVMIAEKVKKDVVYSAECFDQQPLDFNTQIIVEYSIMALEANYITTDEEYETIRKIDGSIDIIKGILKIGSVAFPPAAPVLLFFVGVGSAIQSLKILIPDDRPNKVLEKFKELEKVVQELEKQMDVHFADMQSFMTEHNFNVNIITQASTLMMYMRNCIKYQDPADVEDFKMEYKKNKPLSAVYYMKSLLDNRSTNPLIMAMDAEKSKTKATFKKWKDIIFSILGEYILIEAFASGLLGKSEFNQNQIVKVWQALLKTSEQWADEYKKDLGYWEELKEGFEKYFEDHTNLTNKQKTQEIRERLSKYLTYDEFYICVFNEVEWDKDYGYYSYRANEQIIGSWGKGRCNAFVYRRRYAGAWDKANYETLQEKFKDAVSLLFWKGSLKDILRDELGMRAMFRNFGFWALIKTNADAQIWHWNDHAPDGKDMPPGHCERMYLLDQKGNRQAEYWLIAGL